MSLILRTDTVPGTAEWAQGGQLISAESAWKTPVQVSTFGLGNIDLGSPPATIDGEALSAGDRVAVLDQTVGSQNGLYDYDGSVLVRTGDFGTSALVVAGVKFYAQKGTANGTKTFRLDSPTTAIVIGTTATVWDDDSGGGGGGGDLAATLVLGNNSGARDIEMAAGQAVVGEDGINPGDNGFPIIISPGQGVTGLFSSGVLTVTVGTVVAGYQIDIGRTPFFTPYLTAVAGPRTPGSNNFDGSIGSILGLAAEITAAINDVANSYDLLVTAVDNLDGTITVTRNLTGTGWNGATLGGNPSGDVTGTGFSGGVNNGTAGSFQVDKAGNPRGSSAFDFQTRRTAATEVVSGDDSVAFGFNNTVGMGRVLAFGYDNSLTDPGNNGFAFGSAVFGWDNIVTEGSSFAGNLVQGYHNDFLGYADGSGVTGSFISGSSHQNFVGYFSYMYGSTLSGFNHDLHHGGMNTSMVFGGSINVGAYVGQTMAVGGGHNLGYTGAYNAIQGCMVWGENTTVARFADLSHSIFGGEGGRAEAPGSQNLAFINAWGSNVHATIFGETVWANESSARQGSMLQMQALTTNATPTVLLARVSSFGGYNRKYTIRSGQAHQFFGTVIAHQPTTGDTKSWEIEGLIKNIAGTTTLVGSSVTILHADAGAAAWTIALGADDTDDELEITGTGEAAHTIQWNSFIWGPHAGSAT